MAQARQSAAARGDGATHRSSLTSSGDYLRAHALGTTPQDVQELIRSYLSEEQERAWLGLLETRDTIVRALDAALQNEHHLPLSSFETLIAIAHAEDGEVTISDLARQVLRSPSRVSRLVIEFERQGLVERRRSTSDARSTRAAITQKGRDRLRDAAPTYLATVKTLLIDKLPQRDVKHLANIWDRVDRAARPWAE